MMTKLSDDDRKKKKQDAAAVIYPRLVQFTWGDQIKFSGAIEKFSFKILLFDTDGTPKRAGSEFGSYRCVRRIQQEAGRLAVWSR